MNQRRAEFGKILMIIGAVFLGFIVYYIAEAPPHMINANPLICFIDQCFRFFFLGGFGCLIVGFFVRLSAFPSKQKPNDSNNNATTNNGNTTTTTKK